MREGGGSTWNLRVEYAFGELFDVINFLFFGNEKAEVGVVFSKFFELRRDRGNVELFLQLPGTVLKGLVVQENDIRLRKFLPSLLWNAYVVVLMQRSIDQPNLVATDHLQQFLFCAGQCRRLALVTLEANLDAAVVFIEFDFVLRVAGFFNFLEEMLAVQPDHLHWTQLDCYFGSLLRHNDYYWLKLLISNSLDILQILFITICQWISGYFSNRDNVIFFHTLVQFYLIKNFNHSNRKFIKSE